MPDQLNVHLLYAALFAPLAGALVAGLMGSLFGGHMIRRRTSKTVTVAGVSVSFVCSLIVLLDVMKGAVFDHAVYTWMTVGGTRFEIGFIVSDDDGGGHVHFAAGSYLFSGIYGKRR